MFQFLTCKGLTNNLSGLIEYRAICHICNFDFLFYGRWGLDGCLICPICHVPGVEISEVKNGN